MAFDVYNDENYYTDLVSFAKNGLFIEFAEYSKEEIESASWLIMKSRCGKISTSNDNYTFKYDCPWEKDHERFDHQTQIREYIFDKKIVWKPKNNFYSDDSGDYSTIFCSEYARRIISENVNGIGFRNVLRKSTMKPRDDIFQLTFRDRLPHEALILPENIITITCKNCCKTQYRFTQANNFSIKVRSAYLERKTDAYITEDLFGEGFGYRLIIVSSKVYKVIADMKERNIVFIPIELV